MNGTTEKVVAEVRKVRDLADVIDDKLAAMYPAEWQTEQLSIIQNLMLILTDQLVSLCSYAEKLEKESLGH